MRTACMDYQSAFIACMYRIDKMRGVLYTRAAVVCVIYNYNL